MPCSNALRKGYTTIHIRRIAALLLTLLVLALSAVAFADGEITQKAQLNQKGMKVGVVLGSGAVLMIERELPNAQMVYLNAAEGYEAVAQEKSTPISKIAAKWSSQSGMAAGASTCWMKTWTALYRLRREYLPYPGYRIWKSV